VELLEEFELKKPESLFLSKEWTEIEKQVLNSKSKWFVDGKNVAKATISRSKIPFVKKYWFGGFWSTGTGTGFACKRGCQSFALAALKHIHGVYSAISDFTINKNSKAGFTKIVEIDKCKNSLLMSFSKKRRNSIRQGIKRGVSVVVVDDPKKASDIIFRIKSEYSYWKRKKGIFDKVLEQGIAKGIMKVFVAYVKQKPVAESLFLLWNKRMTYSVSGFLRESQWYRPMDVLLFEAMNWGKENGFKELDLMGGGSKGSPIGKFKSEFGGKTEKRVSTIGIKFV